MTKMRMILFFILGSSVLFVLRGFAATSTGTLNISATVIAKCQISTTSTVAFGNYDPISFPTGTPLQYSGGSNISVKCAKNSTLISLALNSGTNATGTAPNQSRNLLGPSPAPNTLSYNLFTPTATTPGSACAYTTVWGDGTTIGSAFTLNYLFTSSTVAQSWNVCGQITGGQDATRGSYSDQVTITATF